MTTTQKREFIEELIQRVQRDLLERAPKLPEEWDGHELRQWVAERFDAQRGHGAMKGQRQRNYTNEILTRAL